MPGSRFSIVTGGGNLKVDAPGNLESTLGIDAGIAFTLGERRLKGLDGEGARELTALFDEWCESSCSAK